MPLPNAILFHLTTNRHLAEVISSNLDSPLGEAEVIRFADGEIFSAPVNSVRNKNIYIIQSTCPPVTEHLMEVLVFIDALKRASAKEINLIAPYYGYARQDRKSRPREPVTARLVADLIQTAGADRVVMMDLHTPQIQGFFTIPVDNVSAVPVFAEYLRGHYDLDRVIIVSPDHGGVSRARAMAKMLARPIAIIDKRRHKANEAQVVNIVGDVRGQDCILVDDIIDTGGTAIESARALVAAGASSVIMCATHGLFSNDALTRLAEAPIKEIVITDSIPLKGPVPAPVRILPIGPVMARIIEAIENGAPLSSIYDKE